MINFGSILFLLGPMAFSSIDVSNLKEKYKMAWEVTDSVSSPESAYYDADSKTIFVSNIVGAGTDKDGKGHIQKLSPSGKMLNAKWISGLNAPKGMRSQKGVLWVSDIDRVLSIDIKSGKILTTVEIPTAKFLNDVAIGLDGTVYISDTTGSAIYQIVNGQASVFVSGPEWEGPNGLLIIDGKLVVASWGLPKKDWSTTIPGHLYTIEIKTKAKSLITPIPLGNLDGLEFDGKNFLATDWSAGKVYWISPSGASTELFFGMKGSADIGFIPGAQILIIPRMGENKITAYDMKKYPNYKRSVAFRNCHLDSELICKGLRLRRPDCFRISC